MTEWESALRRLAARCNQPPVESERHKKKRLYVRKGGRKGMPGKFTDDQVRAMRLLRRTTKRTLMDIGAEFGCSYSSVSKLASGKSYQWVKD